MLLAAFVSGFDESTERWNGETERYMPCGDTDNELRTRFERAEAGIITAAAVPPDGY